MLLSASIILFYLLGVIFSCDSVNDASMAVATTLHHTRAHSFSLSYLFIVMSECVSPQKFLYVLILGYVKGHIDEVEYKPGEKLGSSEKWFERVIGHLDVPVKPLHIYYPDPTHAHDSLPDLDTCLGVILSGSPCDVTDIKKNGYTWAEPLIPFIRRAYLARIPMFGICFGHQVRPHLFLRPVFHDHASSIITFSLISWSSLDYCTLPWWNGRISPQNSSQTIFGE